MKLFSPVLLMLLFILPVTVSRSQTAVVGLTPVEFNDQLTRIMDSLSVRAEQWGKQFNESGKRGNYADLAESRKELERFIHLNIIKVKAMKDVGNSKALRLAMIDFLQYQQKMVAEAFKPMEGLSATTPIEEIETLNERLRTFSNAETKELGKVNMAQESYASANGFRIRTSEEGGGGKP